jgi:hypothetical protein
MSESDMAHTGVNVTDFCSASGCPEFVVWDFGEGDCYSCKLAGQSYCVDAVPNSCIKLIEITDWIATATGKQGVE